MPDKTRYHHWYEEALSSIPNIVIRKLNMEKTKTINEYKEEILTNQGGIMLPKNGIIIQNFEKCEEITGDMDDSIAFRNNNHQVKNYECQTLDQTRDIRMHQVKSCCIKMKYEIFPHEILNDNDEFSKIARELLYGSRNSVVLENSQRKMPNICHFVWVGGKEMDFLAFLSVLACIYVGKADAVFIHGNVAPTGSRWSKLNGISSKVKFIHRDLPESVYGNELHNPAHISDVWRVDLLLKYGGVYLDWDALILQPIETLGHYDAIATKDILLWKPYPFVLNLGVFAAKKHSKYLRHLKESMRYFHDQGTYDFVFRYNPCQIPYKVYECYPETLRIDPHLQVICFEVSCLKKGGYLFDKTLSYFKGKCHPTWSEDFYDLQKGHEINWKGGDAFAIHWTYPNPPELQDELSYSSAIFSNKTTMALEIANFVIKAASLNLHDILK